MATMKIDTLLKKYKLNQKELAESTGINKNTISRYCNGVFEKIDHNHIDLICKYFKCTPNDIFEIDDTVDVIPAKILYYDDKSDDFTYSEIKAPSNAFKRRATWDCSNPKIPIPTLRTDIEIPESVQKEFNEWIKVFTSPHNFQSKETNYNTISTDDEYIDKIVEQQEFQQKEEDENYRDYIENKEEIDKISIDYQVRFLAELRTDELVSDFLNKIVQIFLTSPTVDDSIKQVFKKYNKHDYFETTSKVKIFYRIVNPFFIEYSNDTELKSILTKIHNVYINGGLEKLSNEDLDNLEETLLQYSKKDIIIKKTSN